MNPSEWQLPFPEVFALLFVIVMLRANGTYWLGRLASAAAHRSRLGARMDEPRYAAALARLNVWGAPAVALSFLTIGVQTVVNFAAGATRMPLPRYLAAVTVGSVAWALIYATVGFVGVESLGVLYGLHPAWALALLGLLIGALVAYVVLLRRRRAPVAQDSLVRQD